MTLSISSIILLLTNASLTLLSIYWAATAWTTLHAAKNEEKWETSTCRVHNTTTESHNSSYCPVVYVTTNATHIFAPVNAKLFPGSKRCFSNETQASTFINEYQQGNQEPCWISPTDPPEVSLVEIETGVHPEDINLAAISTVLAVAALISFAAITFLIFLPQPRYFLPEMLTTPVAAARPGLSRAAVDAILEAAEEADASCSHVVSDVDSTCAICLEEGLGARLPCGHAFHSHCIRAWLMRGGETCPLCCAVVRPPAPVGSTSASQPVVDMPSNDVDEAESTSRTTTMPQPQLLELSQPLPHDLGFTLPQVPVAEPTLIIPRSSPHRLPLGRRTFVRLPTAFGSAAQRRVTPGNVSSDSESAARAIGLLSSLQPTHSLPEPHVVRAIEVDVEVVSDADDEDEEKPDVKHDSNSENDDDDDSDGYADSPVNTNVNP